MPGPPNRTLTQEDPIGLAGGLNLYGFANGDPVNFSDPFGLCPPEDTNTADCGEDDLGNAWRVLDKSEAGKKVISDYVLWNPSVSMGDCGDISGVACSNWAANTVALESGKPGALAVGLTHEIVHIKLRIPQEGEWGVRAELTAWDEAGRVYDALGGRDRRQAAAVYGEGYSILRNNRPEAERIITCAITGQQCQ